MNSEKNQMNSNGKWHRLIYKWMVNSRKLILEQLTHPSVKRTVTKRNSEPKAPLLREKRCKIVLNTFLVLHASFWACFWRWVICWWKRGWLNRTSSCVSSRSGILSWVKYFLFIFYRNVNYGSFFLFWEKFNSRSSIFSICSNFILDL